MYLKVVRRTYGLNFYLLLVHKRWKVKYDSLNRYGYVIILYQKQKLNLFFIFTLKNI